MYELEWKEHALKNLERLESSIAKRIIKKVDEMCADLSSCDIKKLKGFQDYFRLRIGDYRVIFEINKNLITILKIGHRQQIYS
jgi:mRNA interferase RelE/StbE